MKETTNNLDMTTGMLGLTDHEEDLIVIFLQTLSDGFTTPYANADTFTGRCMTGGTAATQGNEFLIRIRRAACPAAICGTAARLSDPPMPVSAETAMKVTHYLELQPYHVMHLPVKVSALA